MMRIVKRFAVRATSSPVIQEPQRHEMSANVKTEHRLAKQMPRGGRVQTKCCLKTKPAMDWTTTATAKSTRHAVVQKTPTVRGNRVASREAARSHLALLDNRVAEKSASIHKLIPNIAGVVVLRVREAMLVKKECAVVSTDKRSAKELVSIQPKATLIVGRVRILVEIARFANKVAVLVGAICSNVAEIALISTTTTNIVEAVESRVKVMRPAEAENANAKIPRDFVVVFVWISRQTASIAEDATKFATPTKSSAWGGNACVLLLWSCVMEYALTRKAPSNTAENAEWCVVSGKSAKVGGVCRWLRSQQERRIPARSLGVAISNVGEATAQISWGELPQQRCTGRDGAS